MHLGEETHKQTVDYSYRHVAAGSEPDRPDEDEGESAEEMAGDHPGKSRHHFGVRPPQLHGRHVIRLEPDRVNDEVASEDENESGEDGEKETWNVHDSRA